MDPNIYQKLFEDGLVSQQSMDKVEQRLKNPLISVHWELKTLLYLGVLLLSTGLGILIYKNIDTIGHQAILTFIALISIGSFAWCFRKANPFARYKAISPGAVFDYVLLLGCLSMLSFLGYLQFQYEVFGTNYGLATLLPMLVLFYMAYRFDHLGVLGLAITNLGLWMGVTSDPYQLLTGNLGHINVIVTALALGLILLSAGYLSERYQFKSHFKFTYQHFGLNISFIALIAGYLIDHFPLIRLVWAVAIFVLGAILFRDAFKNKSFYFLILILLYLYAAVSIMVFPVLVNLDIVVCFMYFIISAVCMIVILTKLNKTLKDDAHL